MMKKGIIKRFNIAIDGPVGSGKTTIGKLLAQKLNYNFLDSGLLYRHFAQFYYEKFIINHPDLPIDLLISNFSRVEEMITLYQEFLVNNQAEVMVILEKNRALLSSSTIGDLASQLSLTTQLRKIISDFQRELTKNHGWVVVGRDITSEVLPEAAIKIYLTADLTARAKRRYQQYLGKMSQLAVEEELRKRDERDTKRTIAPLQKTIDSWELDTTELSPEASVEKIVEKIVT